MAKFIYHPYYAEDTFLAPVNLDLVSTYHVVYNNVPGISFNFTNSSMEWQFETEEDRDAYLATLKTLLETV